VKNIGIVVTADAKLGLGRKIVPFFKGIDQYIHQRVDHEDTQKCYSRQQVQPSFGIIIFHSRPPLSEPDPFAGILPEQEDLVGL